MYTKGHENTEEIHMGIISEVKCGRCDRRYSGFRGRCPYCGAKRNKRGKHADESDITKGRLLVGILLIIVLIAAVVALLVTNGDSDKKDTSKSDTKITDVSDKESKSDKKEKKNKKGSKKNISDENDANASDENEDQAPKTDVVIPVPVKPADTTPKSVVPSPDQQVEVESVELVYAGSIMQDLDFTMGIGETLSLSYRTEPEDITVAPKWESSNINVFVVLQDGTISAVGSGTETLKLTVGTASVECIVRVE